MSKNNQKDKNKTDKKNKDKTILIIVIIIVLVIAEIGNFFLLIYPFIKEDNKTTLKDNNKEESNTVALTDINSHYNKYVITNKDASLYEVRDNNYYEIGILSKNVELSLEDRANTDNNEYFKLNDKNMYIKYDDVSAIDKLTNNNDRYKKYIPFPQNIVTKDITILHINDEQEYILNTSIDLPIIIKDDNSKKYYVEYNNTLVYIAEDSNYSIVDKTPITDNIATSVPVLNYHFVINYEAGEKKLCEPASICLEDKKFEEHISYIKENNFLPLTMNELEMFLDGKIQIPEKSVVITIDDGWFVARSKEILNKYQVNGTLFLIGSLAPVSDYASEYLEVHSHTWNMHYVSNCQEGRGPILCLDRETILEDLKRSRESLNNSPYFCFPFYDYNERALELVKEAGFTMAFIGGGKEAKPGINKLLVPRYVIYSNTTVENLAKIIG